MLQSLHIKNFVLIDEMQIDFSDHLTAITGETGAGKSILLGALNLLLGQRADTSLVHDEDKVCVIEGKFDLKAYSLKPFFEEEDLDYTDATIIRREIRSNGKSRAFVNDNQVTLTVLKKLTDQLIDIHEQFDSLFLTQRKFQFQVIDSLKGHVDQVAEYQKKFRHWKSLQAQLSKEKEKLALLLQRKDFLEFQLNEILQLDYKPGEFGELDDELLILKSAEQISEVIELTGHMFQNSENNILDQIRDLNQKLSQLHVHLKGLDELKGRLESVYIDLEDIHSEFSQLEDEIEFSPGRAEWIETRMAEIFRIMKKHQLEDADELTELSRKMETELTEIETADTEIHELEKNISALAGQLTGLAARISAQRTAQKKPTEKAVKDNLQLLNLEKADFQITLTQTEELNDFGRDHIEFLFSANPGIPLAPVEKVASGGEISRLALAIKALVARSIPLPSIVFDEIDSAVSGSAADKIGQLLQDLASLHQVICITHSPQVASRADKHLHVFKKTEKNTTKTRIRELDTEGRIQELAIMMSTNPPSNSALENAKYLLEKR